MDLVVRAFDFVMVIKQQWLSYFISKGIFNTNKGLECKRGDFIKETLNPIIIHIDKKGNEIDWNNDKIADIFQDMIQTALTRKINEKTNKYKECLFS